MIGGVLRRVKSLWRDFSQNLWFIPGLIIVVFTALGLGLVQLDEHLDLESLEVIFQGDGSAARTVLSVIAGSLITVAGLTFSITMVVLQLASSQFSPRVLRGFFGDRVVQITIGTYVGTFIYSLLVLRAVGSTGDAGFVPRLSVTMATLFGIGAAVLLIVFLNHVSQMVQVSHVTADIARATLARTGSLYPEGYGEGVEDEAGDELLASWRATASGVLMPERPGYVQRVDIDDLAEKLGGRAERIAILVCPGDFTSGEMPLAEVWPPEAAEQCRRELLRAVVISSERDLDQDVDFGLRQLTDTALRAVSPGINDPATAVTCIGYIRSILVALATRAPLPSVRRVPGQDVTIIVRRRSFEEHLDGLLQINRYAAGDAWVIGEVLSALLSLSRMSERCGAAGRGRAVRDLAATIGDQAAKEVKNERDRAAIERLLGELGVAGQA